MKFTKFMTHFKTYETIAFYNLNSTNKLFFAEKIE